jgi:hypothetical protein
MFASGIISIARQMARTGSSGLITILRGGNRWRQPNQTQYVINVGTRITTANVAGGNMPTEQDARERAIDQLTDVYERSEDIDAFHNLCISLYDAGWNARSEENGWVKCSDRLPDVDSEYLVELKHFRDDVSRYQVFHFRMNPDRWTEEDTVSWCEWKVIKWMPLRRDKC